MLNVTYPEDSVRGQFAGHETFPLRHLWLRKAYDAVVTAKEEANRSLFAGQDSIARFGVGKNMALAIRHWALACNVIREDKGIYFPTQFGSFLFEAGEPWDQYMEKTDTIWLLHWQIASTPEVTTTWYFAFNRFVSQTFEREALGQAILAYIQEKGWSRIAPVTVKRDVECFVRSYLPKTDSGSAEDTMESALAELGLISPLGGKSFQFRRGPKPSLTDRVFNYALSEFWRRRANDVSTLSVESITYDPGSPGRVFKLDEDSVMDRLSRIRETSKGTFDWTDTAGIRQAVRLLPDIESLSQLM